MNRTSNYIKISQKYMRDASLCLEKDDLLQAGEKVWGAASHLIKAIAEKNNWMHNGHAELFKVVDKIGDAELDRLFRAANRLHQNFYENWLTPTQIKRDIEDAKIFCAKLINLLEKRR